MFSTSFIQSNVPLQAHTTFGTAALAHKYARITEVAQLRQLDDVNLPRFILGGGSNVIFTRDFDGLVLHMALMGRECVAEDNDYYYVCAAAGESWHDFVQWTLAQGWGGLENLSLIPGSVGAAPMQNIGAYGVEMKECFHSLSWFEFATGTTHTFKHADCQFAYRESVFKRALSGKGVILEVTFALAKQWQAKLGYGEVAKALQAVDSPTPQQVSAAVCAIREGKLPDPKVIGNVGSFFKNPLVSAEKMHTLLEAYPGVVHYVQDDGRYKLAAGWLIEQAGWKGRRLGRVGVYEKQALILANLGGAVGAEVLQLAWAIQESVQQQFGVQLEIEPVVM